MDNWLLPYSIDLALGDRAASSLINGALALYGDNKAHTWEITVLMDKEPADLSDASAMAYFVREDGNTVLVTGTVIGSVCTYVMLPSCYAVKGSLRCVLKILSASLGPVTLMDKIVQIREGVGSSFVDPGAVIPNIDTLIQAAVSATQAANSANTAASTANEAAEYAMQSRFTVLGIYPTLADLQTAHPTGTAGDAYAVGTASSAVIYIWSVDTSAWVSIGNIPIELAVSGAVAGNFAGLGAGGVLNDSGKKASDFANTIHGHVIADISGAIGGENLAYNTHFMKDMTGWNAGTNVARDTTVKLNGAVSVKSIQTGLSSNGYRGLSEAYQNSAPCAYGDTLTMSVYVRTDDAAAVDYGIQYGIRVVNSAGTTVQDPPITYTPLATNNGKFIRISQTITVTASDAAYARIVANVIRNGTVWFLCPKVEHGNIVTDWRTSAADLFAVNPSFLTLCEDWITPTLLNSWTEVSGFPVRYCKDALGFVHLKGRLQSAAASVAIMTLPAGYRLSSGCAMIFPTGNGTVAFLAVASTGNILCTTTISPSAWVDLTGLSYRADS